MCNCRVNKHWSYIPLLSLKLNSLAILILEDIRLQIHNFLPFFRVAVNHQNTMSVNDLNSLKGLAQAKIIKKSVILFRVLNMTI